MAAFRKSLGIQLLDSIRGGLVVATWRAHVRVTMLRERLKAAGGHPTTRLCLLILGLLLLCLAPLVGVVPGPGGIVVAAAGLTLVLRNSNWAKRRYVRFKRWQPRAGSWFDLGMRRRSARRRRALRRLQDSLPEASPD